MNEWPTWATQQFTMHVCWLTFTQYILFCQPVASVQIGLSVHV